jgi:hypothetical protein
MDAIMRIAGKRAYRCHACRNRFYAKDPELEPEEMEAEPPAAPEANGHKSSVSAAGHREDREAASRTAHDLLKDWPMGSSGTQPKATRTAGPEKRPAPAEAPSKPVKGPEARGGASPASRIKALGDRGDSSVMRIEASSGGTTAVETRLEAGEREERLAAPPEREQEAWSAQALADAEDPAVAGLLSRVDRLIESARAQKGPHERATPAATVRDGAEESSHHERLRSRVARTFGSIRKRPSEEERHRIIIR